MHDREYYTIPPPCVIFAAVRYVFFTILLIFFLGYVGKALYMMYVNDETFGETLTHLSFYYPDRVFFFWAIGFIIFAYGMIVIGTLFWRCMCKIDRMERSKKTLKKVEENYGDLDD